jgi:hypothetical protein
MKLLRTFAAVLIGVEVAGALLPRANSALEKVVTVG